jgi:hypothetical protein
MARFGFYPGAHAAQLRREPAGPAPATALRAVPNAPLGCAEGSAALDGERSAFGPGWFDSSWELVCGLDVREGMPADAPLFEWLAAALRSPEGGRPTGP